MKSTNSRRKNNEGSIVQRKDGLWCGVVNLGYDENGKRIRKFFYGKTEKEVALKMREINAKVGVLNKESFQKSFCEIFKEWLLIFKKTEVTSRTFANNMLIFNKHIQPYLQNMSIDEIDILTIKKLLNRITHKEPQRKCKFLLKQFYDYAVEERLTQFNPVLSIKLKFKDKEKQEEQKYKAIRPEDRELFLTALEDNKFLKMLCLTSYYSGLRVGELLGLQWKNIDFDNRILNVEHAITCEYEFDDDGNKKGCKTILSKPKTKRSQAKLPMSEALYQVLKEQKSIQEKEGNKRNIVLTDNENFVFGNTDGSLRTYYGTKTIFERFLTKHNLKDKNIHFHTLRHTFATILKENNVSIYDIQNLLRHTKASTTEIYLSNDAESALKMKNDLNSIFNTSPPATKTKSITKTENEIFEEEFLKCKQQLINQQKNDIENEDDGYEM